MNPSPTSRASPPSLKYLQRSARHSYMAVRANSLCIQCPWAPTVHSVHRMPGFIVYKVISCTFLYLRNRNLSFCCNSMGRFSCLAAICRSRKGAGNSLQAAAWIEQLCFSLLGYVFTIFYRPTNAAY